MDVNVRDYDIKNGLALEQSATNYLNIPINFNKGINELIDGYEAAAVPDNLMAQRMESAAYSLQNSVLGSLPLSLVESAGNFSHSVKLLLILYA